MISQFSSWRQFVAAGKEKKKRCTQCIFLSFILPILSWEECTMHISQFASFVAFLKIWSTVCFLHRSPQTECRVTFDTSYLYSVLCSFIWHPQFCSPWLFFNHFPIAIDWWKFFNSPSDSLK